MGYGRLFFVDDAGIATVTDITDVSGLSEVSLVKTHRETLTNDQIKALPTTAIEIIPAPGGGKIIIPTLAFLRCSAAQDYTNISGSSSISIGYGVSATSSTLVNLIESSGSAVSGLLAPGDPNDAQNGILGTLAIASGATAIIRGVSGYYDSDVENKALSIGAVNTGNFTGGNSANTLDVTVQYWIYTI